MWRYIKISKQITDIPAVVHLITKFSKNKTFQTWFLFTQWQCLCIIWTTCCWWLWTSSSTKFEKFLIDWKFFRQCSSSHISSSSSLNYLLTIFKHLLTAHKWSSFNVSWVISLRTNWFCIFNFTLFKEFPCVNLWQEITINIFFIFMVNLFHSWSSFPSKFHRSKLCWFRFESFMISVFINWW